MTDQFTQNAISLYGSDGEAWIKFMPQLIEEFENSWSLKVDEPFPLSYNYVAPAERNGKKCVLKLEFPKAKEFRSEIEALKFYNGEGAIKLFEVDLEKGGLLLERCFPGAPLTTLEDDEQATHILASVMKKLWKELPKNHPFPHISDWAHGIKRLKAKFGGYGPLPKELVEKAEGLLEELIPTMEDLVLVHGDLHHENVLSSERDNWLAIDPKGIVAEREYETAAMLRNPVDLLTRDYPKKILERRIDQLAEELDLSKERIKNWGVAQTVLSAVWMVEDHDSGWERPIEIASLLNSIKL